MESEVIDQPGLPALREEPQTNPMSLLAAAVERGLSTEQLTALTDLHERWQANRAKAAFARAMNDCQNEMPCIVRESENKQTKSSYAKLEFIISQTKPVLFRHGFSLSFSEDECPRPEWKRTVCLVRHCEGHSERHFIDLPVDGIGAKGNAIGAMNPVQGAISTGTYAQRILTCRIFDLTIADTDLDGNRPAYDNPPQGNEHSRPAPRGQRNQPKPESPPTEVSEQQLAHLVAHWKAKNPDPDGNLVRQSAAYKMWCIEVCDRTFNPRLPSQWTANDYVTCCHAVGCEVLE
jgi:hypothetical protein